MSEQSSKLVRRDLRNISILSFTVFILGTPYSVVQVLIQKEGWFIRYAGIRFPSHTPDAPVQTVGNV